MFKVGDKVKRVRDFQQKPPEGWPDFIEGAVYTVQSVSGSGGWVALVNMGKDTYEHPYNADCFELVKPEPQAAPKFKTGDLARCLHSSDGRILPDVVYTIADTAEHRVYLRGFAGAYHQDIFQIVKPGLTESQSSGIAGGLQEHSVGEYYPLAAVMYEHKTRRIITVENLQTGEVRGYPDGPYNYESFEAAYKIIASNITGPWAKGRVFLANEKWVVAEPANPVRVTRLRNMLHRG